MDVPEPTAAALAQLARRRSQMVAGYFVYSITITILSVYNALATRSFAWTFNDSSWTRDLTRLFTICLDQNVVFGISAVLEASGLAFGVGVSIVHYMKDDDRGLWSDTLGEPYVIALQGMVGDGERGRTLFGVGLKGILCQVVVASLIYVLVGFSYVEGVGVELIVFIVPLSVWWLALFMWVSRPNNNHEMVGLLWMMAFSFAILFMIEVLEAYHLILSGASVLNCTLVVMDSLAIVPLGVVTFVFYVAGLLWFFRHIVYRVALNYCPWSCGEFVEVRNPGEFGSFIQRVFERIHIFDPDENRQRRASPDTVWVPAPTE